jgi:multiple sugar transport system substrate-binding protein
MNRRTTALLAGVGALALALAACSSGKGAKNAPPASGGSGAAGGGSVKSIKVVIAGYSPDQTPKFWNALAAKYKSQTGITANVQVISWDTIDQQVKTMAQTDSLPDVMNYNTFASYAKDGLLYSADEVLSPTTAGDFIDTFNSGGTYNGKVYGFPILSSARALFYNKTLFQQAGISDTPKTWDEFEADAKKITALGGGDVGYAEPLGPEEAQAEFAMWMFNNGGDWQSSGKWTINSAQNVETLQFLKKLAIDDKVTQPNPGKTNRTDGAFKLFESGKAGMVIGFSPLAGELDKAAKVQYGVVPMPTKQSGGTPSTLAVEDYLMGFKHTGNQDAVKKFLDLYYQKDNINTWIKAEGFLPVTKSGLQEMSSDAKLKPYLDTLPNAKLAPVTDPGWDTVATAVKQNLGAAVAPNGDPKKVLDQLQQTAESAG